MTIKGSVNLDEITGLFTKESFFEVLKKKIALAEAMDESVVLLLLSYDSFGVTSTLSEGIAIDILKEISARLKGCLRIGDVIANFDENNIAILLDEMDTPDAPTRVSNKIIQILSSPYLVADTQVLLHCNIGIACISPFFASKDELIQRAEKALEHAKAQGGNELHYFITEMDRLYGK